MNQARFPRPPFLFPIPTLPPQSPRLLRLFSSFHTSESLEQASELFAWFSWPDFEAHGAAPTITREVQMTPWNRRLIAGVLKVPHALYWRLGVTLKGTAFPSSARSSERNQVPVSTPRLGKFWEGSGAREGDYPTLLSGVRSIAVAFSPCSFSPA